MSRSDKWTALRKQPEYYSDFTNNYSLNPETGYLAMITNADAIKNSIRNLVLTNLFERPYQPNVGSKVQSLLFDFNDSATRNLLVTTITETIRNFEPRVGNLAVQIGQAMDEYTIAIIITFTMLNLPEQINFELILQRVR